MNRPPEVEIYVDSFAGGGGASKGMELALGRGPDVAINHDAEAIALHAANHPETEHYQEDVWKVDPVAACRGRRVGLMWLSPDCKHFSKAKGGKPVSPRVRGLAWVAVRWAKAVKPRIIVLENVEEFQTWGPLLDERPDPARKGRTFKMFVGRLRGLGYAVEWRELRACDYGAPTIRKRLFLIARCDGEKIVWPTPTHGKGRPLPWRTAAECIDFAHDCPSIFARKKPLAENTLKRIAAGLRRFVFEADRPFIIEAQNSTWGGKPIVAPTLVHTAHGEEDASGKRRGRGDRDITQPMPTTLATGNMALVEPFLVPLTHHGGESRVASITEPMKTVTGAHRGETAYIAPLLVPRYGEREGQQPRAQSVEKPLSTIVPTQNGAGLVAWFLAKHYSERSANEVQGASLFGQAPTVTTIDHTALVTSSLVSLRGSQASHLHGDSIEEPLRTVSAGGLHAAEVRAFLVSFYSTQQRPDLFKPMPTVTTKDRIGLVTVEGIDYQLADIGMRMLQPRELYRAQGFPDSYKIDIEFKGKPMSKTAQVRMCGNSVVPQVAAAILAANVRTAGAGECAA